MLLKLKIKNIALIDECTIDFQRGLNTLTGETGAGKSIIIDALNFVLGARSDKSLIKSGTDFAKVDAIFETEDEEVLDLLESVGLEKEGTIIVSRMMSLLGKNECRVNGDAVPLSIVKKITSKLVDVFGQNDQQFLLDTKSHIKFLDAFDEKTLIEDKEKLNTIIGEYREIVSNINSLGGLGEDRIRNIDILKYQINEIESSNLNENEEDELLERRNILNNSAKIIEKFNDFNEFADGHINIVSNLKNMANILTSLGEYIKDCDILADRLNSAKIEVEDIVYTTRSLSQNFEYSEAEINEIEDRLDLISTLKRKYGNSIKDVIAYLEKSKIELNRLENAEEELYNLNNQKKEALKKIFDTSIDITNKRKQIAVNFEDKIKNQLKVLGMKNADFKVDFADYSLDNIENIMTTNGADEVEFLFSANLGEPLKPLVKIISGGEMSRFMLAFKTVINNFVNKTYVFDEIDTGIGGSIGVVVAKQMSEISRNNQVLCITHLAQIACFADNMLKISKYEEGGKTFTSVKVLSGEENINEITRLIGTNEVSEFAYKHAEELMKEAIEYKNSFN